MGTRAGLVDKKIARFAPLPFSYFLDRRGVNTSRDTIPNRGGIDVYIRTHRICILLGTLELDFGPLGGGKYSDPESPGKTNKFQYCDIADLEHLGKYSSVLYQAHSLFKVFKSPDNSTSFVYTCYIKKNFKSII